MDGNENVVARAITSTFEQELRGPAPRIPLVWDEGRYRYYRVEDAEEKYPLDPSDPEGKRVIAPTESRLSAALTDLKKRGVKVLDHKRVEYFRDGVPLCDWVIKTMIPRA